MTDLNLTGQSVSANQIQQRIDILRNLMEERKPIWDKISVEKKKLWITSGKDPIMSLAWTIYKYLRNNFFGEVDEDG